MYHAVVGVLIACAIVVQHHGGIAAVRAVDMGIGADDDDISQEEMDGINNIIQKTDVMRVLREQNEKNEARIQEAEFELERMLNGINDHFEEILSHIESTEQNMQERLKIVEDAVHARINATEAAHEGHRTAWRIPFAAVAVCVLVLSVVAWRKYKELMKTHLL